MDEAEPLYVQGLELTRSSIMMAADVLAPGYLGVARLKLARGDGRGALQVLREFEALARRGEFIEFWVTGAVAAQARFQLALGDTLAASAWAAASGLGGDDDLYYPRELDYLTLARVWTAQGQTSGALHLLGRWLRDAEAKNWRADAYRSIAWGHLDRAGRWASGRTCQ